VNDIKKLRFLLKKGFLFKDFEREELMTLSLAIILILKIYAVHEVSEKTK
jgi:hypothetical protein